MEETKNNSSMRVSETVAVDTEPSTTNDDTMDTNETVETSEETNVSITIQQSVEELTKVPSIQSESQLVSLPNTEFTIEEKYTSINIAIVQSQTVDVSAPVENSTLNISSEQLEINVRSNSDKKVASPKDVSHNSSLGSKDGKVSMLAEITNIPSTGIDSKEKNQQLEISDTNLNQPKCDISTNATSTSYPQGNATAENVTAESKSTGSCYCGKGRDLNMVELQCAGCYKWFHQLCINIPIGKCLPLMTNYTFVCKSCSPTGTENFVKRQSNFSQICLTAIANLMQQSISEGRPKALFSRDKEIVPFIDRNWPFLTTMQRRIKQTWHNTVQKTMLKDGEIFVCEECLADNNLETQQLFGIAMQDLYKIGPDYENKFGHNPASGVPGFNLVGKSRGAKRKIPSDNFSASASKKPKSDLVMPKLPLHGYPLEHPFNKDGYRYILAEPDPHAPFRQEFDESSDWAGKPIPGWLYRTLIPNSVLLAMHDRGPQLRISEDRLSVTGEKGYCMVRATHGVGQGSWYFECTIEDMPEGSATRLGWSQSLGNLQAPLGFDKFSYSWRSRKGTKFHQSHGLHYCNGGYTQGDILGCLIELPPEDRHAPQQLPPTYKEKPLVKFKSYLYFEEKDEVQAALKHLHTLPGSKMTFYKNGTLMGVAYQDIYAGIYYPAISLYKNCTVSINFGPYLKYPPRNLKYKQMYEAAHQALIEQTASDLAYFTENDGKLRLDSFMC